MQIYFGDVSLFYTYSLAMALEAYGYDLRPEYLEALMLMGNGASIVKDDEQQRVEEIPRPKLDVGRPDRIDTALVGNVLLRRRFLRLQQECRSQCHDGEKQRYEKKNAQASIFSHTQALLIEELNKYIGKVNNPKQ